MFLLVALAYLAVSPSITGALDSPTAFCIGLSDASEIDYFIVKFNKGTLSRFFKVVTFYVSLKFGVVHLQLF